MNQEREKPKTILLRKRLTDNTTADHAAHWARLGKALKTFTDLEELEVDSLADLSLPELLEDCDHLFLHSELTPWTELESSPLEALTIVFPESFPWNALETRNTALKTLARHPSLTLNALPTTDLVRILHYYLMPKRLAGVTPMMEKGSLIVAEKVMDPNNVGSMLDRLCAFLDLAEGLELKSRIPDLRQVLSALIFEGLRYSSQVSYPFVDFQASASRAKLGVNLRFPSNGLVFEQLIEKTLAGSDLFWNQIWQCSDHTMLTHHKQHQELEVTILLSSPTRDTNSGFKTLLYKTADQSSRKESLLEDPGNFTFKLLSDVRTKNSEQIFVSSGDQDDDEIDFGSLPDNVGRKITGLLSQCETLNDQLLKKDAILQDALQRAQHANRELATKRSELLRAIQTGEAQAEAAERRIRELETKADLARKDVNDHVAKNSATPVAIQETLSKLETMLRASENEKNQLRESVIHEQKRVSLMEQKYSQLYKDISVKDREINELKTTFAKMRKDHANKQSSQVTASSDSGDKTFDKLKEVEEREASFKQELRKLNFKLESQEKNIKAIQNESAEKIKMLDQKLKVAKAKEIELLKKIEDLMASLKKAVKAA